MCVGLASPEFRTLITMPADEAATQAWGWDLEAVLIMLTAAFLPLNEP